MQKTSAAKGVLIVSLVFVFGYFGIDKLVHPEIWIGWIPQWMEGMFGMTRDTWLPIIGVTEIVFAALLLIPVRKIQMTGAVLIALHLLAILTQVGWNDIGVRDIGLLLSSIALFLLL